MRRTISLFAALAAIVTFSAEPGAAQTGNRAIEVTPAVSGNVPLPPQPVAATTANAQVPTGPERRIALIIGNSAYAHVPALANPANDANYVAGLLRDAAFEVVMHTDLGQDGMYDVVREFSLRVGELGPNAVALIYYAGHGVQIDGENYLVPVDAKITGEYDVPLQAVRLGDLLNMLAGTPAATRIVILDACRNNPFEQIRTTTGHGLAIVNAPPGSLLVYSTSPGAEADDGTGTNSPFTSAFVQSARTPGLSIEETLKNVRLAVHDVTRGRQTPWEVSALTQAFAFFPGSGYQAPQADRSPQEWRRDLRTMSPDEAYRLIIRVDVVIAYQIFIELYPRTPFNIRVRNLLDRRLEMQAWFAAVTLNSAAAMQAFLERYPNSDLAETANRMLERAQQRTLLASNGINALGLNRGPNTVIKEVPVDRVVYQDRVVYVDKPVIEYRDRIVEKIIYRDKPVIEYRDKIVYVPKIEYRDKLVEKIVYVPKVEYRDRIVEKIVYKDRIIYKDPPPCKCPSGPSPSGPILRVNPGLTISPNFKPPH